MLIVTQRRIHREELRANPNHPTIPGHQNKRFPELVFAITGPQSWPRALIVTDRKKLP